MVAPPRRSLSQALFRAFRRDHAVSEVLGNVLLVSITVGLLGGFGALVLATVSSDTPTPPAASFTMEPVLAATSVPVRMVSGVLIDPAGSTLKLHINGADRTSDLIVLNASTAGKWSPGETLRVNITGAALAANDTLRFFAVDNASGKMIGTAYGTVSGTVAGTVVLRNTLTAALSFDRSPLLTDGATAVNATVTVTSSNGLLLVAHVTVDLSSVGGPTSLTLYDNGVAPDEVAGDGLFSTSFSVNNYTYTSSPGYANVTIPASVQDVLGRTVETNGTLALASATPSKVGPGVTYRRIGSSDVINLTGFINLSAFAFRDTSAVDNDQVELRVSDLDDSTKVWSALVSFANTGCPTPSVTSIVLRRDGVAGNVTYTPAGGCFAIGSTASLNLANITSSLNATGQTNTWNAVGTEATYQYAAAGISASNEALIAFFGDTVSSSPFARGLSQTDFSWAPPISLSNATVPIAIADLAATPGNAYVDLTWSAPASGGAALTGYGIYRDGILIDTIGTNTTYRAAGLTNGVLYSFDVRAINAIGTAAASNAATATPITTPGAPTGLLPTSGNHTVALSWNAPSSTGGSPIIDYQIYSGTTIGATTWLATTGGTNTTFIVNSLTNGTQYFFNITSRNAVGQGASGPQVSSTPSTIPNPPDVLSATPGDAQATLSWTLGENGGAPLTDHRIYRSTTSGATTLLASTGSGANTSFIDMTAANGVTYYYNVTALNAKGVSASSNEVSTTPASGNTAPSAPTSLSANPANQSVVLTWSAPASDGGSAITDHLIYVGTSSGGTSYLASTGGTNTTFTVNGLTNGQQYFFNVTALNSVGQSVSSNEASATAASVPYPPTNLAATRGNTSVSLSWTAPANTGGLSITTYNIYRGTSSGATTWIAATGAANTSFILNALTNGQQYFFNVTAQTGAGQGAGSNEATATPSTLPYPPDTFAATAGDGRVTLTWALGNNGGSPLTDHHIYRSTTSGATTLLASTGSGANTSFIDLTAVNGVTYYYNMTARNAHGVSVSTPELSAAPASGTTAPSAPQSLSATRANNSVALSWSAPSSDGGSAVTHYLIYVGTTSGGTTYLASNGGTNTTFIVNGLTNGQQYFFNVTAVNSVGQSPSSNEAGATPASVPYPPTNLAATRGNTTVSLSWTAPANNGGLPITSYNIYRGTSSGATTWIASTGAANTTFIVNGLTNGQQYFFNVTTQSAAGQGAGSNEASAIPATIPNPPASPAALAGDQKVTLTWSIPSNGGSAISTYKVYAGTASGATTYLATTGSGANTSFVVNGLTNGQQYFFNVTAVNAVGESATSAQVTATPAGVPSAPLTLGATGGNRSGSLSWSAPSSNGGSPLTNYHIYASTTSGATTFLASTGGTNTTFVVNGLTNGQQYFFNVTAVNTIGQGASSNEASATPTTIPNPPAALSATRGNALVSLSWSAPADIGGSAITNYHIYRGTTSGATTFIGSTGGANTTFVANGLTNGQPYFFNVTAVNAKGQSATSNEATATPATVPSAPQGLGATKGNRSVSLSWSAPASNGGTPVTNYHIYRGTTSGATVFIGSTGGTNTSFVANGLTNGQLYHFNVTAINVIGQGPSSNEASATPSTVPDPPSTLSATRGNQSVSLTWSAPADIGGSAITGYNIYRGTSSGATTFIGSVGVVTSTVVTSLTNGQAYFFNITAVNANGQSSSSNEASATPATVPNPPATFTATAGTGQVSLAWTAGASGGSAITNYQIWRGASSGGETLLTTIGTNLSFVDAAVTGGTTYYYQMRAVNAIGASNPSIERSATPTAGTVISSVSCPVTTTVQGTIDVCANIQSADASYAQLDESAGNPKLFDIRFTGSGTTATGTHTLQLFGRQSSSAEDLHVQAWTGSAWRTVVTMPASGTSDALYANTITTAEFNNGSFLLRIVDDNTLNGGSDSPKTTWLIDYLRVVTT